MFSIPETPEAGYLVVNFVLCSVFVLHCKNLLPKNGGNFPSLRDRKALLCF